MGNTNIADLFKRLNWTINVVCIVLCMALYSPGFMAKKTIANYYFIGPISCGLNCLFVNRENEKDKKKNLELLLERQKAFYEAKNLKKVHFILYYQ